MESEAQQIIYEARRERLNTLIRDCGDKNVAFIEELNQRLSARPDLAGSLKAFLNPAYVSNVINQRKNIGEESASALEQAFEKPRGWMSTTEWPFKFPKEIWDSLNAEQRDTLERQMLISIRGLQSMADEDPPNEEKAAP